MAEYLIAAVIAISILAFLWDRFALPWVKRKMEGE